MDSKIPNHSKHVKHSYTTVGSLLHPLEEFQHFLISFLFEPMLNVSEIEKNSAVNALELLKHSRILHLR